MADSYLVFDGGWFRPTDLCRGPWDASACHAGPPIAAMAREAERRVRNGRLARLHVELIRPIPISGFRVRSTVVRPGRSVITTEVELFDDTRTLAVGRALHLRTLPQFELSTAAVDSPDFGVSVPGPFPIQETRHDLVAFPSSVETRYDPAQSLGKGGPTTVWIRSVPILPDENPTGFQRLAVVADCGNGVSYNDYLDRVSFLNADLSISVHREPVGEWIGSRVVSHWQPDGVGLADAELFDVDGPVGRATQTLLLAPHR